AAFPRATAIRRRRLLRNGNDRRALRRSQRGAGCHVGPHVDRLVACHDGPPPSRPWRSRARPGHGAEGARSHTRLLRLPGTERPRPRRPRAVPDALDHPFLRADLHLSRRTLGLSLWDTRARRRRGQPLPVEPWLLALADRVHARALRLVVQLDALLLRHAGD